MCHAVLQDPAFFHFLTRIDEEFAAATRLGGCRFCAGPLHVANYPRKPRGCPAAVYDLTARSGSDPDQTVADVGRTPALTAKGLGGEQFEDYPYYRDGGNARAAVYDLAVRTDNAPCESYPCYLENAGPATPIAAEAGVTHRAVEPRS